MDGMTFNDFRDQLAEELDLSSAVLEPTARLVGDLAFDSFMFFRLAIFIEVLTGNDMPVYVDPAELTVADVHAYCASSEPAM